MKSFRPERAASWRAPAIVAVLVGLAPAAPAAEPDAAPAEPPAVQYGAPKHLCNLDNPLVDESSGLAVSRRRKGVFWTHNDSGDREQIYAFDLTGKSLGAFPVEGADAWDWEDIASFTADGKSYLLLADVGDNGYRRLVLTLYLLEEPAEGAKKIPVVQKVDFHYTDDAYNCEAVAVDPTTRQVILIAKERVPSCKVFLLPWPKRSTKKPLAVKIIGVLKLVNVTAMDISPDGRRAVVLTYGDAYEFTRKKGEDWAKAFSRPPRRLRMPKRDQGESICYGLDGKTLYLTSEKRPTPLFVVPVKKEEKKR